MKNTSTILGAAIALNLTIFKYAAEANKKHNQAINLLSQKEKMELQKRNLALKNDPLFNSESPYLRAMAIARYQQMKSDNSNQLRRF